MTYVQNEDKLHMKQEDYHYIKVPESPSPMGYSSQYPEMWRTSPGRCELSRTPLELNLGPPYQMSHGYDMEPVQNVVAFSPTYKEFAVLKEKPSQDVADALLSLHKHAVVHPHLSGRISPLSPTMHLGPVTPNGTNGPVQHALSYSVNHGGQGHPMAYSGRSSPQYPAVHAQFHNDHVQGHGHGHGHQQQGMFTSMSVNVSMNMNVVPPNFVNNQYNPSQQWPSSHPQHYALSQEYPHASQGALCAQYGPYSPTNHHYSQSYSLTSDFRSGPADGRNFYYKSTEGLKDSARYYNTGNFKRAKRVDDKPIELSHGIESGKLNLCRICGKTYARPSTLKTHLRTHSGEKPYKCSTCSKSFSQAANLTAHIRTHSGEKPFHCPVCDRHFSQSSSVTTHMRTHSGERPYLCKLCQKAFSDSSTLTKHLRIHSGEKPYQCKLCLLRFSQSGNLNRHMRIHLNNG